jgi:hypothetical protein
MRARGENAMTLIEIQDAYIERLRRMRPLGLRASGVERHRQIRAARRQAKRMLHNLGYSGDAAAQIVKDAHDVWELEGNPQDAARRPKRKAS